MLDFSVDVAHWPAAALQQRVAITTGSYDHAVDGVALTLNRLAAHLLRQGHEVLVLSPGRGSWLRQHRPVLRHAGRLVRIPSVPLPIWSEYRLTFGLGKRARAALADPHTHKLPLHLALGNRQVAPVDIIRPDPPEAFKRPSRFPCFVKHLAMVLLYGRDDGRLANLFGGFRPGQSTCSRPSPVRAGPRRSRGCSVRHTMRLEFSAPPSHRRLAFSIQAPETRFGYLQTHRIKSVHYGGFSTGTVAV